MDTITPGAIVSLKSGHVAATVLAVKEHKADLAWFSASQELQTATLPLHALKQLEDDEAYVASRQLQLLQLRAQARQMEAQPTNGLPHLRKK